MLNRTPYQPGNSDLLGYTLLLAAALHGFLLLGIGFVPKPRPPEETPRKTLRVVVGHPQPQIEEESATKTDDTAKTPVAAEPPPRQIVQEPTPAPQPKPEAPAEPPPPPKAAPQEPPTQVSMAQIKPKPVEQPKPKPQKKAEAKPKPKSKAKPKSNKRVTAAQLLASRNEEISRLSQQLERKSAAYANRPRRKAISASTTEYKYAAYLDAWRRKVERIGNLNYPDEARRKKLYGNLVLHVAVRADGSIAKIRVLHSSGEKVLDQAAVRIVRMSAPFAPFPKNIRKEADILDITRTWRFLSSNRLK